CTHLRQQVDPPLRARRVRTRPPRRADQPVREVQVGGAAGHGRSIGIARHAPVAPVRRALPAQAHDARGAPDSTVTYWLGVDRLVTVEREAELRVELERAARILRVDAECGLLVPTVAQLTQT